MEKQDLLKYLSKRVRLTLTNSYNFTGNVTAISDNTLSLVDKFGHPVSIRNEDIMFIIEVSS